MIRTTPRPANGALPKLRESRTDAVHKPARAAVRDRGHFLPADEHDRQSSCNQMSSGAWVTDLPEELVKLFAGTYLQAAASHLRSVERLFLVVRGVCAALRVWEFAALEELHVIRAGKANAERAGTCDGGAWDDEKSRQWLCALVNDTARFCFDKDANPSLVEVPIFFRSGDDPLGASREPASEDPRTHPPPFAGALPGDAALDRRRRAARAREQLRLVRRRHLEPRGFRLPNARGELEADKPRVAHPLRILAEANRAHPLNGIRRQTPTGHRR